MDSGLGDTLETQPPGHHGDSRAGSQWMRGLGVRLSELRKDDFLGGSIVEYGRDSEGHKR